MWWSARGREKKRNYILINRTVIINLASGFCFSLLTLFWLLLSSIHGNAACSPLICTDCYWEAQLSIVIMMIVRLSRTSARRNLNKQLLLSNTYSISHDYQRFLFTVVEGAHSWHRRTKLLHLVDSLLINLDWFPSIICIGLCFFCYYTFFSV